MDAGPNDPAAYVAILERVPTIVEQYEKSRNRTYSQGMSFPTYVYPVLTLDEFFIGNRDGGSVMCNLDHEPRAEETYEFLKHIESRPEVSRIFMIVTQWDGPGHWPFSDAIIISTTADMETVRGWFPKPWTPTELTAWNRNPDPNYETEDFPKTPGYTEYYLWYD